jgi:hypothetical protein
MAVVTTLPWQIELLIPGCAGLALLQLLMLLRLGGRVRRLERLTRASQHKQDLLRKSENDGDDRSGPFDEYLSEDPQRLALSRSEQLEGYRRWRKENGLSWPTS